MSREAEEEDEEEEEEKEEEDKEEMFNVSPISSNDPFLGSRGCSTFSEDRIS